MTLSSTNRSIAIAAACLAVVVAVAGGLLLGDRWASGSPSEDSVDAGFARDMQIHHAQAVEMSLIVRDRTEDQGVRTLAYDILTSQQQQRGQMSAWLIDWDLPQTTTDPVMQWMGGTDMSAMSHGEDMGGMDRAVSPSDGAVMPGMATDSELDELAELPEDEAEILYLELMTVHHRAGVVMAQYAVDHATQDRVVDLAQAMVNAQDSEIDLMNDMLEARGADRV